MCRACVPLTRRALHSRAVLQVSLLPCCKLEPEFVGWLLASALDAVMLRVKGRTVTLFRCALDSPSRTRHTCVCALGFPCCLFVCGPMDEEVFLEVSKV
jgi:hypothetical protein